MGRYRWSKVETVELIKKYEEFPELWDPENEHYDDVNKAYKAYLTLAQTFRTSEGAVRRKLEYLTRQFNGQLERMKENVGGHKWKYFKLFSFLLSPSDKALFKSESEESDSTSEDNYAADAGVRPRVRTQKIVHIINKPYDLCQIFGDYVAGELRSLESEARRKELKMMIQKCIIQINEQGARQSECESESSSKSDEE